MVQQTNIPLEPQKLSFVLLFLVVAALSNWAALSYVHDFIGRTPLPDIVFTFIDEQPWAHPVGDFMVSLSSASLIFLFVLHKHRVLVIRRTLFITGCLYSLRTLMMLITQLPSGYSDNGAKCRAELAPEQRTLRVYIQRTLEQTIHVGFQDNTKKMLCGDLLFSGHTLIMMVATLTIDRYIPSAFRLLRLLPRLFALIGVPCMVISRTHYTCDVVIAYLSTIAIFSLYHAFCEIDSECERKRSVLSSLPLMGIVSWLEENTITFKSKNEFEFPFLDVLGRNLRIERRTMPGERADKCVTNSSSSSSTVAIEPV
ncbi:hypothetical protein niasHT_015564 [Heterodera trifolii]|uniref:Sphingomyelin synthase-like domain-containing protein n=1 Tax=Heterodera trifolii TaxID=157864 RepID=A0ABD2L151_9BILA